MAVQGRGGPYPALRGKRKEFPLLDNRFEVEAQELGGFTQRIVVLVERLQASFRRRIDVPATIGLDKGGIVRRLQQCRLDGITEGLGQTAADGEGRAGDRVREGNRNDLTILATCIYRYFVDTGEEKG